MYLYTSSCVYSYCSRIIYTSTYLQGLLMHSSLDGIVSVLGPCQLGQCAAKPVYTCILLLHQIIFQVCIIRVYWKYNPNSNPTACASGCDQHPTGSLLCFGSLCFFRKRVKGTVNSVPLYSLLQCGGIILNNHVILVQQYSCRLLWTPAAATAALQVGLLSAALLLLYAPYEALRQSVELCLLQSYRITGTRHTYRNTSS